MNVNSIPRGSVIGTLAGSLLLPWISQAQDCTLPAMPDATVTSAQDRDRMLCQLGISFPVLPPRLQDPNRPINAWPVNAANPEGNRTDALGHTLVRTNFGLWHTCDDSAGSTGGAMSVSKRAVPAHPAHGDAIGGGCTKR